MARAGAKTKRQARKKPRLSMGVIKVLNGVLVWWGAWFVLGYAAQLGELLVY